MPLERNIVKIRQVLAQNIAHLSMLKHVLLFKPEPLWVDFAKVLNQQAALSDALFAIAEYSETFRVDTEVRVILALQVLNRFKKKPSQLFLHVAELSRITALRPKHELVIVK